MGYYNKQHYHITTYDDLRPWGGVELERMACYADVGKEPS